MRKGGGGRWRPLVPAGAANQMPWRADASTYQHADHIRSCGGEARLSASCADEEACDGSVSLVVPLIKAEAVDCRCLLHCPPKPVLGGAWWRHTLVRSSSIAATSRRRSGRSGCRGGAVFHVKRRSTTKYPSAVRPDPIPAGGSSRRPFAPVSAATRTRVSGPSFVGHHRRHQLRRDLIQMDTAPGGCGAGAVVAYLFRTPRDSMHLPQPDR